MIEKEMEDLLWSHPEKFLHQPLEQFSGQQRSAIGRSDLIFTDRIDRLLIVEIKKGKLGRDAVAQVVDYFGMIKKQFPSKPVELMLVANSIPEERRLACEQYNIEPREIPEKAFRDVAQEVGYQFESEKSTVRATNSERESFNVQAERKERMMNNSSYILRTDFDRETLNRLLNQFESVVRRTKDKSISQKLRKELLENPHPNLKRSTLIQLATWCKTGSIYSDGMEVARKISELLFGQRLDRRDFGA